MNINTLSNIIHNFINYDTEFSTFDVYKEYKQIEKNKSTYNNCKKTILSAVNEITALHNYKKSYISIDNNVYTKYSPLKSDAKSEFILDIDYRGRIYIPKYITKYINIIKNEFVTVKYSDNYIYIYPLDSNKMYLNSFYKSSYIKANKSDAITVSIGKSLSINDKIKVYAYNDCLIIPFSNE